MRLIAIGPAATAILFACAAAAPAQAGPAFNYPWCAHYMMQNGPKNCGFTTLAQCWQTVSGIGGFATPIRPMYQASRRRRSQSGTGWAEGFEPVGATPYFGIPIHDAMSSIVIQRLVNT